MPSFIFRRMAPTMAAAGLVLGFAGALRCQPAAAKRLTFAATSVKLDKTCERPLSRRPTMDPVTLHFPCLTPRMLIGYAYSGASGTGFSTRAPQVVGGPAWIGSDIYSIDAKPETSSTAAEMMGPMLQSLLEDRFRLRTHLEPRETPVYFLTVAEPNPKLRPVKEGECVPIDLFEAVQGLRARPGPDQASSAPKRCEGYRTAPGPNGTAVDHYGWTMSEFATKPLTVYAGRPVIDNTGLKGRFDLHLEFDPRPIGEGKVRLNGEEVTIPSDDSPGPLGVTIFTALRKQLGLKLTPGKAPLDVIVVDHVERPSEN